MDLENETEMEGLPGAVDLLLKAGAKAESMDRQDLTVEDHETTLKIPVVSLRKADGSMGVAVLLDETKRAYSMAREMRLLAAPGPDRREGIARLQSVGSLIAHVNRFKDSDSAIWADGNSRQIVAILDYHKHGADGATRWGKHRSVYPCPLSEQWQAWGGEKGLTLDQDHLSALLDSRDREIISGDLPDGSPAPSPAQLLTMAQNLETYSSSKTKRERDPKTGKAKLLYSSESGFLGDITPPPSFLIRIPVFQGERAEPIEVRLRFSVQDGAALFMLAIHAPGDVLRDAFQCVASVVGEGTGLPVFVGCPE